MFEPRPRGPAREFLSSLELRVVACLAKGGARALYHLGSNCCSHFVLTSSVYLVSKFWKIAASDSMTD